MSCFAPRAGYEFVQISRFRNDGGATICRRSNFSRNDVKRIVQAMEAAGRKIARVELHGSKVLIIPADDECAEIAADSNNSFDKIMRI